MDINWVSENKYVLEEKGGHHVGIYKAKKAIVIYVYYPLLTHNSQKGKIVIFIKILNEYKSTILFSSLISEGSSKMEKKKKNTQQS